MIHTTFYQICAYLKCYYTSGLEVIRDLQLVKDEFLQLSSKYSILLKGAVGNRRTSSVGVNRGVGPSTR